MKKICLSLMATFCLLGTSCSNFSTPQTLIKAPAANKVEASEIDTKSIVQSYLPSGAKLLSTNEIVTGKPLYNIDLDGDKQDEIIAFFKIEDKFEKGFIVLKKKNGNWEKILEKREECNSIAKVELTNVESKDKKSLLVGFLISSHAGSQYNSYTLENNSFKETKLGIWNKFEIINTAADNDKGFVFAVWQNDIANVQRVEVLKLLNNKICYGEDFYFYFRNMIPYYNSMINENNNNELAWYYLIDAQIKGDMIKDAYKSMEAVSKIDKNKKVFPVTDKNKFKILKIKALIGEKNFKEASALINELIKEFQNNISSLKGGKEDSMGMFDYLAKLYLDQGKVYLAENNKEKAKESFTKALNIFEDLNKNGFYGDSEYMDIHKDLDINTVKSYLEEIK